MPMRSPGRVFWPLAGLMVLEDVVRFTLLYNKGAAFSTEFGPYQRWFLIGATLVFLLLLAQHYRQITDAGRLATVGLALLAGGAVGNLLDRLTSARGVVDFIDVGTQSTRFYVFNFADAGVTIGAILLGYALWRHAQSDSVREVAQT